MSPASTNQRSSADLTLGNVIGQRRWAGLELLAAAIKLMCQLLNKLAGGGTAAVLNGRLETLSLLRNRVPSGLTGASAAV